MQHVAVLVCLLSPLEQCLFFKNKSVVSFKTGLNEAVLHTSCIILKVCCVTCHSLKGALLLVKCYFQVVESLRVSSHDYTFF